MLLEFITPLLIATETTPANTTSFTFEKEIFLWEKTSPQTIPSPIAPSWNMNETIHFPHEPGTFHSTTQKFIHAPYSIQIDFFWIRPVNPEQSDYWVTQTRLEKEGEGVIVECSRFNEPKPTRSVGIGACAGQSGSKQIGVTIQSIQ